MRYSISNIVIDKYGSFNDETLSKLSIKMEVSFKSLDNLIQKGIINEEDFKKGVRLS